MDQYIGRLLDDRYEILEVIGTGGMAVVYKARCHRLNRLVAIKILKDEFARDEEFRRRFHAEGEAVAMLSHPNIVQVYDVSSTADANFIVMELIDGISLKQYMEKKGVLNWKETLHFAMQIAKGLEHAHSRGIIHRDIKPHNVMVLKNGSVKVMDFGIARVMSKSNTLTKEALGSVHYISPEQAKGGHTDNRSDIYSLSVVMYEMMAGRPPYDGESPVAVAIQHINGGATMPSNLNPNIPGGLEQIIMKGMSLEIQDRFVSATEMLLDMEEFRKNPAILFNYKSIVDGATRPITSINAQLKPRTTAEKVVQAKTGNTPSRDPSDSMRLRGTTDGMWVRQDPAAVKKRNTGTVAGSAVRSRETEDAARRAQQRRMAEERKREEEQRSRVATVAIVVCSAVAIFAIVIFLVALFNGVLLNKKVETVKVPSLVGEVYSDYLAQELDEFSIQLRPQQYDSNYEKGVIMSQEPAGGTEVKAGADIWITISMGAEPEVKIMDDYVGFRQEEVKSALTGQGFQPLFSDEPSDEYPVGVIIRTDPVKDTELEEGQAIKIFVSSGPDVDMKVMPNVVGKPKDHALDLLKTAGFNTDNVTIRTVESDEPAGVVIYQSAIAEEEIDVTTEIFLEVSSGPAEEPEEKPPVKEPDWNPEDKDEEEEETQPAPVSKKSISFALPERDTSYTVTVLRDGVPIVSGAPVDPSSQVFTVPDVTGSGSVLFQLVIDGAVYSSQVVEF